MSIYNHHYHDQLLKISRKNTSSGLWLGFIIPALLFKTGNKLLAYEFFLSFISLLFLTINSHFKHTIIPICIWLNCQHFYHVNTMIRCLLTVIFVLCFSYKLMRLFPCSFTFGETILIAHLCAVFLLTECNFMIPSLIIFLIERYSIPCSIRNALLTLATAVILIGYFWISTCRVQLPMKFILNQIKCFLVSTNFILCLFWLGLFVFCVYITIVYRLPNHDLHRITNNGNISIHSEVNNHSTTVSSLSDKSDLSDQSDAYQLCNENEFTSNNDSNNNNNNNDNGNNNDDKERRFQLRKLFHFAAGIVYATGLLYAPHLLSLTSTILLFVFWYFEWIRRRGPSTVSSYVSSLVNPFRDKQDSGEILFTPIALLLGLSIPIWWPQNISNDMTTISIGNLCYELNVKPSSWSGVLSIAIGDSFAALIGRAYGKRRWPGSHRTYLGSLASFLSQIIAWTMISYYYQWHWFTGILPIFIGVLIEAYTDQIDNLVIPLIVMIIFL